MENDLWLWVMALCIYAISVTVAFYGGRAVEQAFWKAALPAEMTTLCEQCRAYR